MYSVRLLDTQKRPFGPVVAEGDTLDAVTPFWQAGVNAVCWSAPEKPIKRLHPQTLERVRALKHNRRIEKKMPLLAPLFSRPVPPKRSR